MKEKHSLRIMIDGNTAFSFRSSRRELGRGVIGFSSVREKFQVETSEVLWSFLILFWKKCSSSFRVSGNYDKKIWGCIRSIWASGQRFRGWWIQFGRWRHGFNSIFSVFFDSDYFHHLIVNIVSCDVFAISFFCNNLLICITFFKFDLLLSAFLDVQIDVLFPVYYKSSLVTVFV